MEELNYIDNVKSEKSHKLIWIILFALIGLGLSIKLSMIYFTVNFVKYALPSFCVINEVIDCDAVAQTSFAQFLGVPLAIYGCCLYLFVLFLCFVDKLCKVKYLDFLKVFKNKMAYIFSIYCFSFVISMILTFVQFHLIQKFCLLCFVTYLVDLVSLLIAKDYKKPIWYEIKVSVMDFIEAVKVKSNLIALIILMLFASSVLCYAKTSYIMTPHMKKIDSLNHFKKLKGNPFKIKGNTLGNPDGDVVVYEYSDFMCPICPIMNRMLQKAATEFENIYVIHYNYPLDMNCNRMLRRPFHQGSCQLAKYAIAAKKQDKYWEMINILFTKQPESNKEVQKLAQKNGIDVNQLVNDYIKNETDAELQQEIESGIAKEINATPTITVNGEKHSGVMSYDELKELLIKHGAKYKGK